MCVFFIKPLSFRLSLWYTHFCTVIRFPKFAPKLKPLKYKTKVGPNEIIFAELLDGKLFKERIDRSLKDLFKTLAIVSCKMVHRYVKSKAI